MLNDGTQLVQLGVAIMLSGFSFSCAEKGIVATP